LVPWSSLLILRVFIVILFACSYASGSTAQQAFEPSITASSPAPADFNNIVVPITAVKITPSIKLGISGKPGPALGIGAAFGTGFCLDPACHFIATNYHVAVTTQAHKVKKITLRSAKAIKVFDVAHFPFISVSEEGATARGTCRFSLL